MNAENGDRDGRAPHSKIRRRRREESQLNGIEMSLVTSAPTVLICSSRCESAHYIAGGVWMERNSSRIAGLLRGNFRLSRWDERRAKIILHWTFGGSAGVPPVGLGVAPEPSLDKLVG